MRLKDSIQYMLWKGFKDIILIVVIAVVSGTVLALILKPTGVEAQTYAPDTTNVQTPEVTDSNSNGSSDTGNPDDQCKDYKGFDSEAQCRAYYACIAKTKDPTSNVTVAQCNTLSGSLVAIGTGLNGSYGEDSSNTQEATSPFWRKVYASISPTDKYGLTGLAVGSTYYAMLYNPIEPVTTTGYYAYNFIPKPIRQEFISDDVYAATHWTLGNPPDGKNSFVYLNQTVGQIWLAMFKITTGIFVIVLTAAGIMIILRQKVGQNVVSVYMALKNIVIGYIGAFLSLGFGAFFFTFSKWLMLVFAVLLRQMTINGTGVDAIFFDGMISGAFGFSYYTAKNIGNGIEKWIKLGFSSPSSAPGFVKFLKRSWGVVTAPLRSAIGGLSGLIVILIVGAAVFYIFVKVFLKVLNIYISMLIDTVLAPLFFLLGSIPGNESTISDWFKRMFKNSLKVPLMFLIVNLGFVLMLVGDNSLKAISGGALSGGQMLFGAMGLYSIIPLVVISSANGIDKVVDQMFGGPSKTAGTVAAGAKELLKGAPVIGGLVG